MVYLPLPRRRLLALPEVLSLTLCCKAPLNDRVSGG